MAAFNKFNSFVAELANGAHSLGTDTLKVYLTNEAPSPADTAYDGIVGTSGPTEISGVNGYTTGGLSVTVTSSAQTSGVYTLVLGDPALLTATGGSIGPFRYIVLYNTSATNKLIGWWDYGVAITLADTESFQVDFDQTNGVLTLA